MASLTTCLKKAGEFLSADDRREITAAAAALRKDGAKAAEAARQAVEAQIAKIQAALGDAEKAMSTAPALNVEASARQTVEALAAERPDMMVALPGTNEAVRLDDALEMIRAQQALDETDAELLRAAVLCDLSP